MNLFVVRRIIEPARTVHRFLNPMIRAVDVDAAQGMKHEPCIRMLLIAADDFFDLVALEIVVGIEEADYLAR